MRKTAVLTHTEKLVAMVEEEEEYLLRSDWLFCCQLKGILHSAELGQRTDLHLPHEVGAMHRHGMAMQDPRRSAR